MSDLYIGVNGINKSGPRSTEMLTNFLSMTYRVEVANFSYAPVNMFNAESRLQGHVESLEQFILDTAQERKVHLIGHSYGCLMIHQLMWKKRPRLRPVGSIHLIAPAMRVGAKWAPRNHRFGEVHAYVNPRDWATKVASWSHLFAPRMGRAGNLGFSDQTVDNTTRHDSSGPFNHTKAWFDSSGLEWLGRHIFPDCNHQHGDK